MGHCRNRGVARCALAVLAALLACALIPAAAPAQSFPPPDLGGVSYFNGNADELTEICDPDATSTLAWQDAGTLPAHSAWPGAQATVTRQRGHRPPDRLLQVPAVERRLAGRAVR